MPSVLERIKKIQSDISQQQTDSAISPKIIAVSKTFPLEHIKPLVDLGHIHFGENKVQEAEHKWTTIKKENKNLKIHMLGKLQTNKVKKAIQIFDCIQSVDSLKLLQKIDQESEKASKTTQTPSKNPSPSYHFLAAST